MAIGHTLMREHISLVNSRQFSPERTDVTIEMALDAIGADFVELLLADDEDGVWQMDTDVTIPANVSLHIPLGVTLVGPGNVTILGGLETLRWPVHLGPGTILMTDATLSPFFPKLTVDSLYGRHGEFDTLTVRSDMRQGIWAGAPTPSPPPDQPTPVIVDWSAMFANQSTVGGAVSSSASVQISQQTALTANTLPNSVNVGVGSIVYLDTNDYRFQGIMRPAWVLGAVYGNGIVDSIEGCVVDFWCMETSTTTVAIGFNSYPPSATTTGVVHGWEGMRINDAAAGRVLGPVRALTSFVSIQGVEDRYNLYLAGSAPNFLFGKTGIGGTPTSAQLFVNGTASKPGGGSWTDSSSETLKKNIQPLTNALSTLLQLAGKTFEWDEPMHAILLPGTQVGLMAENVQSVIPIWVSSTPDGVLEVTERGSLAYVVEALREMDARLRVVEGA